jgi:two-component sensor histidine kinase
VGRLADLDLTDRLAPVLPRWVTQLGVGVLCIGGAGVLRVAINLVSPGAAPFALIFPALILATLLARWSAGAVTAAIGIGVVVIARIVHPDHHLHADDPRGALAVIAVALAAALTIAIAELFRKTARLSTAELDREIADRDLLLSEFDHRVKNNFAIVASLLDLQRRRAADPATAEALEAALLRVESIARAHRHLYRSGQPGTVEMRDYVEELCSALSDSLLLRGAITLSCESDPAELPRDRAVSIGLVINELVTNAAKHAFVGRPAGTIRVLFRARPAGWTLIVADDGTGIRPDARPARDGGLGMRLIEAFARQAGGKLSTESGRDGTTVTLDLAP